jgi:hypothetical protein
MSQSVSIYTSIQLISNSTDWNVLYYKMSFEAPVALPESVSVANLSGSVSARIQPMCLYYSVTVLELKGW